MRWVVTNRRGRSVQMMRRLMRKPLFWIVFVVLSFVMNLILAVYTLHRHIRYEAAPQTPFNFLSSPRTFPDMDVIEQSRDTSSFHHKLQASEADLWRRMLKQEDPSVCGSRSIVHAQTSLNLQSAQAMQLRPRGFRTHIEEFMNTSSVHLLHTSNQKSLLRGSLPSEMINSNATWEHTSCYLPPSTACAKTQYSVLMYSRALNLRRLVRNLMSFLAYPSVHDITLILPSADSLHSLQWDVGYGSRILDWKNQGTIQIVFEPTLWESLGKVRPRESAVLWVDGDRGKDWNGTKFRTTFRIWRQHVRALITPSVASFAMNASADNFLSQCQGIQDVHGSMMHRNWICFLQHPVLNPLRNFLESFKSWEITINGLSIIFNQLSEGHILALGASAIQSPATLVSTDLQPSTTILSSVLSHVVTYFGCGCAVNAIVPLRTNSTCIENYDENHLVFIGDS